MAAPAECAVIDTNVVLDWLVFGDVGVQPLVRALAAGQLRWVATQAMVDELAHVLGRPFDARWTLDPDRVLATVHQHVSLVPAAAVPGPPLICRDPDDQKFIDLALAWPARWLFSRDRALLHLARRALPRGVTVLAPARWQASGGATPSAAA
ncbi:PIN domain-containing protein [Aquabacterium sp. OR-4]|uniref:PIN domain-containing protein n=1 Tax=Aquabacterium sp. OR-4 TaxID=2978127 RepID=UPI0021B1AEDE|nr:PIN domain-containing protein [Aquabacterium sp. OR-4]MDT7834162.1 PIN domain-containing protein [Aquabacterium sp. OR-4]